jgi:hypothetical protein
MSAPSHLPASPNPAQSLASLAIRSPKGSFFSPSDPFEYAIQAHTPQATPPRKTMAALCRFAPALGVNTVRAAAAAKKPARAVATFAVNAAAASEPRIGAKHWLPGTEPPAYLDGTMAGDYGGRPKP